MKKTITTLLIVFISFTSLFSQAIPELLYYKFDGTGTSVPNLASSPPVGTTTATLMGGLTQGSTGQCQGAVIGSGTSSTTDYVNTGYATNLTGTSWTISMWTSNITASATLFYIFGDVSAGSFRCFTNGVAGANNWILRGTGITDVLVNGGATVAPHVTTFVYDMTAGNIKAYLDGVLVNTVAQGTPSITGAGPFKVIGYSGNVGAPAGGLLDEFRMYNRALSASEVALLANPPAQYSSFSVASCISYTVPSGNATYATSGVYMDTIPSIAG
ncbi:MAG TPA: LamG domain-containing protein, partial [Bacteroidia bacterium]|nr:LamG domain-containing protein [Bacteroidia bacterium]